jgi:hypothetical protein
MEDDPGHGGIVEGAVYMGLCRSHLRPAGSPRSRFQIPR